MTSPSTAPLPPSELDRALSLQLIVAWAGEGGEEARLGWWRTQLASEFGGYDLFRRLMPRTWKWAVLQALREAARRHEARRREHGHDPDRVISLFTLGFRIDELLDERLQFWKSQGDEPAKVLPALGEWLGSPWDGKRFAAWVESHGEATFEPTAIGRQLKGKPPEGLTLCMERLLSGLSPLEGRFPLPYFRRSS